MDIKLANLAVCLKKPILIESNSEKPLKLFKLNSNQLALKRKTLNINTDITIIVTKLS